MIQDIEPRRFHNEYRRCAPQPDSRILCYRERECLARLEAGILSFLTWEEVSTHGLEDKERCTYLFSIDAVSYFLIDAGMLKLDDGEYLGLSWHSVEIFRTASPAEEAFAGVTGYQLAQWYASRKYCPRCGRRMVHDERERMMRCEECGQTEYPKISPAVIVGVTEGDRILLTKYAGRSFKKYALIAGFAEIGETIEETVQREVMEEVGLKVRNIRYYKSQPWSFSSTLLMGFFAEVDGADTICMDRSELSVAKWCTREEVPEDDGISLTREMMGVFKAGGRPGQRLAASAAESRESTGQGGGLI